MKKRILASINYKLGNIEVGQEEHPNAMPWSGILLVTDQASDQAPSGAEGHRILVPKSVAEKRLKTLKNMGLNYKGSRDGHAVRNKVGVITDAWMEGNAVKVKGVIWKKDFPEAVNDLKGQRLGMSMELAKVDVENPDADIWNLQDFVFTGATALWPQAAAYHRTALAASRDKNKSGGTNVKKKVANKGGANVDILATAIGTKLGDSLGVAIAAAMEKSLAPTLKSIQDGQAELLDEIRASRADDGEDDDEGENGLGHLEQVLAGRDDDDDGEDLNAKGRKDDDDDDDEDEDDEDDGEDLNAGGKDDDSDDDDDEDEDDEDEDEEDGEGKRMKTKRMKSRAVKSRAMKSRGRRDVDSEAPYMPITKARGRMKSKGVLERVKSRGRHVEAMAAAAEEISENRRMLRELHAEVGNLRRMTKSQRGVIKKMEAQQDMFSEHITRRTLPPEAAALLQKSGVDAGTLYAEGRKLSVGQVDQMLAEGAPGLEPKERMGIKNILLQHGLMDEGVINRQLPF